MELCTLVRGSLQDMFICIDCCGGGISSTALHILLCVTMMDRTIKEASVIQERDVGCEMTEDSQNLTEKSWSCAVVC